MILLADLSVPDITALVTAIGVACGVVLSGIAAVFSIWTKWKQSTNKVETDAVLKDQTRDIKTTKNTAARTEKLVNGVNTVNAAVIAGQAARIAELEPSSANIIAASHADAALKTKIEADKAANAIPVPGTAETPTAPAKPTP